MLHDIVYAAARRAPWEPALLHGDRVLTFADLAARVRRTATWVARRTEPGERLAVVGTNHPAWIDAYYGVPAAGRVLTFLNHRLATPELRRLLDRSGARVLLADATSRERLGPQAPPGVETTVGFDEWDAVRDRAPDAPPESPRDGATPAWLIFTSGTTAAPKGALLTHDSVRAAIDATQYGRPVTDDDVYVFPFPLCHVAGYNVVHHHARVRPVVLLDRFTPEAFIAAVDRHRATSTSLAATMLTMLLDHGELNPRGREQLASLRSISYGAAPMSASLLRRARAALGVTFAQGYGMTELSGNAVFLSAADHSRGLAGEESLLRAAGRPAPGVEIWIAGGAPAGEILVRGPQIMAGYADDPAATEQALRGGWLHTGDVGHLDDGGLLYVTDRAKDVIVTGGENVSSRQVEDVLAEHRTVRAVAVVGVPDAQWGELVCAVIVPRHGRDLDPATGTELTDTVRRRLGGFATPRRIVAVDSLPTNAAGKVVKTELRAQLVAAGTGGPDSN